MADGEGEGAAPPKSSIEQIVEDANKRIEEAQAQVTAAIASGNTRVSEAEARVTAAVTARDSAEAQVRDVTGRLSAANDEIARLTRENQELRDQAARVSPGDAGRQGLDLSGVSPGEKIRQGLAVRSGGGR